MNTELPKSTQEAAELALYLAITAPTKKQSKIAFDLAVSFKSGLTESEIEDAKANVIRKIEAEENSGELNSQHEQ